MVYCMVSKLQPLRAEPEDIPLDIVYEDEHVLVVNKPAHMVSLHLVCACHVACYLHLLFQGCLEEALLLIYILHQMTTTL